MAPDQHPDANLVSAWLEGGLGAADRERVTAHLNRCRECRQITACAASLLRDAPAPWRTAPFWSPKLALAASLLLVLGLSWPLSSPWLQARVPVAPSPQLTMASPAAPLAAPVAIAVKLPHPRLMKHQPNVRRLTTRPVTMPMAPAVAVSPVAPAVVSNISLAPPSTGFADQPPRFGAQQALAAWGGATQALPISSAPSLASRLSYAGDETLDFSQASMGSALRPWGMGWTDAAAGAAPSLRIAGLSMRVETAVGSVLWAAARNDQVFTSADHGAHWRPVVLPGAAAASASVVSITFADAQTGSIRDRRGATWLTHDGGITWTRH
jgi:hypothetical protein